MACQILDFLPFFTSSRPPFLFSSILPFFLCFWDLSGAYCGVRQGGFQGDVPRVVGTHTPLQLRLKIALVFDSVFLRFWLHFDAKMTPKIHENLLKITFESALQLRSVCDPIFIDFSVDFRLPGAAKTQLKLCSVVRFYTFPIFLLSFLLGSILDHIGLYFGVVLGFFF